MGFLLKLLDDSSEKLKVMKECDSAFTISVFKRSFFSELFDKIDHRAIFIAVYTDAGAIAGYSAFYANDPVNKKAFLTLFCIRKEMQRMHLGSRLMDMSFAQAREKGMKTMDLEVLKEDMSAIAFYRSCGFKSHSEEVTKGFIHMTRSL